MMLFVLRHADAQEHYVDYDRPLSKKGISQMDALGRFLPLKIFSHLHTIYHSPLIRAKETAELFKLSCDLRSHLKELNELSPGSDFIHPLASIVSLAKDAMIVGHNPDLEHLVSYLMTGDSMIATPTLKKSSLVCLEQVKAASKEFPAGLWTLHWLISPKIFK